jgi:hypothetical protein
MEFFDWCAQRGIQLDQSKGASKTGEAGFNFGTCHVYFPVRFDGAVVDVLEMATPTQDLNVFAPEPLVDALLDSALANHGIMHLLFHPAHVHKPEVAGAIGRAVAKAKAKGLEWWTARQVNTWERARRGIRWSNYEARENAAQITLESRDALAEATVLWLAAGDAKAVRRWGFDFSSTPLTLAPGERRELTSERTRD